MNARSLTVRLAVPLVLILAAIACGDDDGPATTGATGEAASGAESSSEVEISGFLFTPSEITVDAGGTVTFTNGDDIDHTVTAGTPDAPTGEFDLSLPEQGASDTLTLDEAGDHEYFCSIHTHMRGSIQVVP